MRTLAAGLSRFRASPASLLPITAEGVVIALLIAFGVIPSSGASAAGAAVFPLDVFFDLKQLLAQASSWPAFFGLLSFTMVIRSGALASTVVLADRSFPTFRRTFVRALALVCVAMVAFVPAAVLMFSGVASRYAPFVWVGALVGTVPALVLARRAVRLDAGVGAPSTKGLPEVAAYLAYAYVVALVGAAMSSLGGIASAGFIIFTAPINALVFLGWREQSRVGTYPGGGSVAVAVTIIAIAVLAVGTVYDRYIRESPPVARAPLDGTLLLLGGVDSTLTTGALTEIDVRHYGFPESRADVLSYRGAGERMTKADTRTDLGEVALAVSEQIEDADEPVALLGHSQASLILDRLLDRGSAAPSTSVILAPPPPFPPPLEIPPPGENGIGRPGGDLARGLAAAVRGVGMETYDVDTGAFPTNLEPVVLIDARVARLSVWALGDSVWLDRDWRRPGEVNVVALTDHVGVVNNARAMTAARDFFAGTSRANDEASWRGAFVSLLRHAFAPWRPAAG